MPSLARAAAGAVHVEHIMGVPIVIDARDAADGSELEPLFAWFREVDRRFSTYIGESEICRLGRGELALADAHPDVREVLDRCEVLRTATDGYFDARARRADELDPSGLVKGWSVDRACAIAEGLGWRNYAISAGGDIRLRGGALPSQEWHVGIENPRDRGKVVAVVAGGDLAVATSGAYLRGDHVVDPHTRRPADGMLSVTVTGPDLATADALATAIFAMGAPGRAWAARLREYQALLVTPGGAVLRTPGFPIARP